MKIKFYRVKSLFSAFILMMAGLLSLPIVSFADFNQREIKIQRELDCIANAKKSNTSYSWADVCYTKPNEEYDLNVNTDDSDLDNNSLVATTFALSSGYRRDNLQFSIAGNEQGTSPNILSELTWSDIQSMQIQGKGEVVLINHFVFEGSAAYARIFAGDNQDSDYYSDDRTDEFSRSNNSSNKGDMRDFSGGLGFRIDFASLLGDSSLERLSITPLVGYALNEQNLKMQDGFQTIPAFASGFFDGLNSTYETQWEGPWVGTELQAKVQGLSGILRFEYHKTDYYAQADWNLRDDFAHPKSYEHIADSRGYVIKAGLGYELTMNWTLNFGLDYYRFKTDRGVDRTFFSDGTSDVTQLNVVKWDSLSLNAGLQFNF